MNKVLREEKKFLISIDEFRRTSGKLEKVMIQDPHNGTHGYIIRSLYYDTPYDTDYFEKAAGVELRRKIRLRIYDPRHDFAMLEMKQKQGTRQLKRSLRVSRKDAIELTQGRYECLLKYHEPFAAEIYAFMKTRCYNPCTIVQYHRKAFIAKENQVMLCIPRHIPQYV